MSLSLSESGRWLLRKLKYEVILGQPIINGIPRTPVPCASLRGRGTLVVLAFGQSNAANYGAVRREAQDSVYNFHHGRCYRATDPMLGSDGGGGSVWSRLGDRLVAAGLASRVVFATIAVGGSDIARWSRGDLHDRLLKTVAELRAAGLPPDRLVWHQGEADRLLGTGAEAYRRNFIEMLNSLRLFGVDAPVFVAVATYCNGEGSLELQRAQRALVDPAAGIYPGPNTDIMTGLLYRYDDCHFSAYGQDRQAEAWFQSLRFLPE